MTDTGLTFLRYEEGDKDWDDLQEKIIVGDTSYKCPTYVHRTAPCQGSCPSGHDIRGWLAIARGQVKPEGDMPWQEMAFRRMTEANPFPAVMGRVCPAPCEDGCNRNEVDDHVGINAVEHYVGDWAIENGLTFPKPEKETGKKIAVIGGGPGGLSAAYHLRREGHAITVFDDHDHLGGMMRYGIPGFRTPRDVLDAEIKRITDMGVETKLGCRVGKDISMEEMENNYDAVFWALGAKNGKPLPIPGSEAPNMITGVDFLDAFNQGRLQHVTGKVIVIGGGDTSVDVATVARRLGHITHSHPKDHHVEDVVLGHVAHDVAAAVNRQGCDVTLTSLFPMGQMFASDREVEDALHEGVTIQGGVMPVKVRLDSKGRAIGLEMVQCTMKGNAPEPVEGTEYFLEAELIVAAIGQSVDFSGIEKIDGGNGFIKADKHFKIADLDKHFAGGDVIRPHLLTTAIGHGRIAAQAIEQYMEDPELPRRPKVDVHHFKLLDELRDAGKSPEAYDHKQEWGTDSSEYAVHNYEDRGPNEIIPHSELFKGHFLEHGRNSRVEGKIDADKVIGNFDERLQGFTEEQAIDEGKRCMSCGMCFECDSCVVFCPQDAVFRVKKNERTWGRYVDTDYSKCVGCHICRDVCPTGYIQMGLGE